MNQPNFFESGSPFLHHPMLTAERTMAEIDFVLAQLALPNGARILDVGCGFGRHSIELAKHGFEVTGIDPAAAMITAAKERAKATAVAPTFQQIPAEQFTSKKRFDAAICLFTTLGQISSQENDNRCLLTAVYNTLKPGGSIVVEVPQHETAVAQLKPFDKFGNGEHYTAVTKKYNPTTHIVTETFEIVSPEQAQTFLLRYRLFTYPELCGLLNKAGYTVTATFSDYAGEPLRENNPTMLLFGRK